jgi:hypothetical protein
LLHTQQQPLLGFGRTVGNIQANAITRFAGYPLNAVVQPNINIIGYVGQEYAYTTGPAAPHASGLQVGLIPQILDSGFDPSYYIAVNAFVSVENIGNRSMGNSRQFRDIFDSRQQLFSSRAALNMTAVSGTRRFVVYTGIGGDVTAPLFRVPARRFMPKPMAPINGRG